MAKFDWLIIEHGKCNGQVFSCNELLLKRAELQSAAGFLSVLNVGRGEPHYLFACSFGGVFYPLDEQGVNALCRFEREAMVLAEDQEPFQEDVSSLESHLQQELLPAAGLDIWLNPNTFAVDCMPVLRAESNLVFPHQRSEDSSAAKSFSELISSVIKPLQVAISRVPNIVAQNTNQVDIQLQNADSQSGGFGERGKIRLIFDFLLLKWKLPAVRRKIKIYSFLLLVFTLGLCLTTAYYFGSAFRALFLIWSAGDNAIEIFKDEKKLSFTAKKLTALNPAPMQAMERAIVAKVKRDPTAYSRALLFLDTQRKFYPADLLPSKAFIAAIAMNNMSREELDGFPAWRSFLTTLRQERSGGISVVSYEESKIREQLAEALLKVKEFGVVGEQGAFVKKLFTTANKAPVEQKLYVAAKNKKDEKKLLQLMQRLQRLRRVFKAIPKNEQVTRNILVSQAVFQIIQLSWIYDSILSPKQIDEWMQKIEEFLPLLPRPEKDILNFLIEERLDVLQRKSSQTILAGKRVGFIAQLHEEGKLLCDPWASTLFPDFFAQTVQVLANLKDQQFKLVPLDTWSQCFSFKRAFYPLEASDFKETKDVEIFSFLPRNMVLRYGDLPSFAGKTEKDLVANKNGLASWIAYGVLSDIFSYDERMIFLSPKNCGKMPEGERLCRLLELKFNSSVRSQMDSLRRLQEDLSLTEQVEFSFLLALNYYARLEKSTMSRQKILQSFSELGFHQFVGPKFPEFATLEWYIKNILLQSVANEK